jgi:glycosyltransferase involved in cell wall biosynthesis
VATPDPPEPPVVDIAVPVRDEAHVLAASIERLHAHLAHGFPYSWRLTIVDNGSSDATLEVADDLAARLDRIRVLHLDEAGRGRALRRAWTTSDAQVVAYLDVDLSTELEALVPLISPVVSGRAEVAIGSRLAPGARVTRGWRRELISRAYNLLVRRAFATRVRDAQCGFKAVRADVARALLPEVADQGWFFDTELLLLAEHNGLRIDEVPVRWVEDHDSRVRIVRTAIDDLRGLARVRRTVRAGRGRIRLDPTRAR